ncbi:MAG: DUF370 domain-containing protein [Clostridiales bacterium]|nr:DUF370 domain-containing protein [Clostridiales bacterium]
MFVHIGGDISVISDSITAVISLETAVVSSKGISAFMNSQDDDNRLQYLTEEIPKSLIVTDDRTYVSSISSSVLLKRLTGSEIV